MLEPLPPWVPLSHPHLNSLPHSCRALHIRFSPASCWLESVRIQKDSCFLGGCWWGLVVILPYSPDLIFPHASQ